jgi:hypothetical protein
MGQGGGVAAINPPISSGGRGSRNPQRNSGGSGSGGGLAAKMAARKAERAADAQRNRLQTAQQQQPPPPPSRPAGGGAASDAGDADAAEQMLPGGDGKLPGRHYSGRHHSIDSSSGNVGHLDADLERLEAELLTW